MDGIRTIRVSKLPTKELRFRLSAFSNRRVHQTNPCQLDRAGIYIRLAWIPVSRNFWTIRFFYGQTVILETLDDLGVTVLVNYLKKVNLPVIPTYFSESPDADFKFDWIKTEVELKKTFATDTFIGLLVDADIYNRSNNVIYMGTPDSNSPLPSPLKSQKKVLKTTKSLLTEEEFEDSKATAYKNMVKGVVKIISQNQTGSVPSDVLLEDAAALIWNISRDVADVSQNFQDETKLCLLAFRCEQVQLLAGIFQSIGGRFAERDQSVHDTE